MMNTQDLDRMLSQYVGTALWSSTDESDEPMDSNYGVDDVAPATLAQMREDCKAFGESNAAQIEQWAGTGDAWEQAGQDFWFTRNGHGCGFWDRGLGEWPNDGADLTQASRPYGSCDLYISENLVHLD